MISRIEIQNFQSHRSTVLEPGPGGQLTVITGPSDSGKTAALRALRWLYYNTPQGMDFARVGCTLVRVIVVLEDGTEVERLRTPSKNQYIIRREGVEPQVFEGFGSGVPLEVQETLGVRPVEIGDLSLNLNLAEQLDGPFLGRSISAGARAKVLGKLAGTEEIDVAAKTLGTDVYRRGQDEKRLTAEVDELAKRIEGYAWVPELGHRIQALEGILAGLKAAEERKTKLGVLASRLLENASQARLILTALDRLSFLPLLESGLGALEVALKTDTEMQTVRGRFVATETAMAQTRATLARLAGVDEASSVLASAGTSLEASRKLIDLRRRVHENDVVAAVTRRMVVRLAGAEDAAAIAEGLGVNAARLTRVRDAGERLRAVESAMVAPRETAMKSAKADEAHQVALDAAAKAERLGRLVRLSGMVAELRSRFDQARAIKERAFYVEEAIRVLADVAEAQARRDKFVTVIMNLIALNSALGDAQMRTERWTRVAESAAQEYVDELLRAGRCPTCGSIVDNPELLKEAV